MQGSDEWRVNNINGQDVRTKPPYPGIGRCSAKLSPCPFPVSANQVSMSPVVVPGRDAALMEFEEAGIDFLSPQSPADFSTVRWDTPLGEVIVPGSSLGDGNEDEVKPSQAEVHDIVPPLVVWEELFNASEAWFADGFSSMGVVQGGKGEGEDSGRVVEPSDVSTAVKRGSVVVGRLAEVLWVFLVLVGCLVLLGFVLWLFSSLFLLGERGV